MKKNEKAPAPMQWRSTEQKPQEGQQIMMAIWDEDINGYLYIVDRYMSKYPRGGYLYANVEAWQPVYEYEPGKEQ